MHVCANYISARRTSGDPRRRSQAGYSLLLAIFMVATMLIAAMAIAPLIITQGRREQETEMIWRGEQYERAIGLYYRKFGKYPTKIEDLTMQTNGVRFLRQAYKDPTNTEDGSWRFIYVGPNGQLIGSTRSVSLLQGALQQAGLPGLGSSLGGPAAPSQNPLGSSAAGPGGGAFGFANNNLTGIGSNNSSNANTGAGNIANGPSATSTDTSSTSGTNASGTNLNGAGATNPFQAGAPQQGSAIAAFGTGNGSSDSQPVAASDISSPLGSTMMGGNIIGVGSKTKKPSLRIYMKGDTYDKWEFIWNPLQQTALPTAAGAATAGQAGQTTQPGQSGQPQVGQPGQSPFGSSPTDTTATPAPSPVPTNP